MIVTQGAERHRGCFGFVRLLNDDKAALRLDGSGACRCVEIPAGQHDPDRSRPVCRCRRLEKRVRCRAGVADLRAAIKVNGPRLQPHVEIGRRNVDPTAFDGLAMNGMIGRDGAGSAQEMRQKTGTVGTDVDDDKKGRCQVGRKLADQSLERLNATSGRRNDNNVPRLPIHAGLLSFSSVHHRRINSGRDHPAPSPSEISHLARFTAPRSADGSVQHADDGSGIGRLAKQRPVTVP